MSTIYAADRRYTEQQQQQHGDVPVVANNEDADKDEDDEGATREDGEQLETGAKAGEAVDTAQHQEASSPVKKERRVGEAPKQRKKSSKKLTDLDLDNATESDESDEYKANSDEEASAESEDLPSEDEYVPSDDQRRCVCCYY